MSDKPLTIRTLIQDITDINGCVLYKNISFIVSRIQTEKFQSLQTCKIYIDNGKDSMWDFDKHIVFKKLMLENSI